jgi:hypothetical protein
MEPSRQLLVYDEGLRLLKIVQLNWAGLCDIVKPPGLVA